MLGNFACFLVSADFLNKITSSNTLSVYIIDDLSIIHVGSRSGLTFAYMCRLYLDNWSLKMYISLTCWLILQAFCCLLIFSKFSFLKYSFRYYTSQYKTVWNQIRPPGYKTFFHAQLN